MKVYGEHWMRIAVTDKWSDSLPKFVDGAYDMLNVKPLESRYSGSTADKPHEVARHQAGFLPRVRARRRHFIVIFKV